MSVRPVSSVLAAALSAVALAGCGEDQPIERPVPAATVVRDVYGLGDGSCWRYRFTQSGASLYATITASGPNTTAIAGRSVYVKKFQLESGGLPTEDYFDTESKGQVVLLRHVEGGQADRVTKRYENDPTPPLFAQFTVNTAMGAILNRGTSFDTTPTPEGLPIEHHRWSVLATDDMVSTPDGMQASYKLQYNRDDKTAIYNLVPRFGVAKIVDFDGTTYQVCAARVCDSAGTCTGAASCDALVCN